MNNPDSSLFHASEDSNLFEQYWSSLPIRLKGVIVIALPMCALLFVSTANIFTDRKQLEADKAVRSITVAEASSHDLLTALQDAETGVHEYALTGDPLFLRSYEAALAAYPSLVRVIGQTGHGAGHVAPAARNAFDAVNRVKRFAESRFPQRGSEGLAALLIDERASKEKLTVALGKLDPDPPPFIEEARGKVSSLRRISRAADVFAIVVAIFGFILSTYLLNRVIITRIAAAYEATQALAAGLPIPLPPGGKDEIGALMTGMRHASALLIEREQQLVAKNADLARALASVKEASEHKSRFLANMSHELRTPLNSIIGFTEVVHDKRAGELTATQQEFLGDSLRSARHLLALINDILDLEKIASGHLALRPELFDLHQLIGETIHELSVIAGAKNINLSTELDDLVRRVFLDRQKTKQILLNLVTNALKFTAEGGRVGVHARAAGIGRCVLEIEDTGVGISAEGQTRLFREFEQLESTSTKRLQGTGLGLALTKRLVEAQGGTIAVASQVGVGSAFCVMLPTALEPKAPEGVTAAAGRYPDPVIVEQGDRTAAGTLAGGDAWNGIAKPAELAAALNRFEVAGREQHILVVDDDINIHKLTRMALKDSVLGVVCCFDGDSALIEIARDRPAAVVVDLLMPNVDGFNFIARLQHIPGARAIPVIVWTNLDLTARESESLLKYAKKVVNKRDGGIARLVQEL
jgi:signal transduction histidine kinase